MRRPRSRPLGRSPRLDENVIVMRGRRCGKGAGLSLRDPGPGGRRFEGGGPGSRPDVPLAADADVVVGERGVGGGPGDGGHVALEAVAGRIDGAGDPATPGAEGGVAGPIRWGGRLDGMAG